MHLLPVLDLQNGQVVHARGGRRQEYQQLTSCWTAQAHDPKRLMFALQAQLGCKSFYIADLDALEGRASQREVILSLIDLGTKLWLDAGVQIAEQAQFWLTSGVDRLIIASESLPSREGLTEIVRSTECDQLVFSLDFFRGKLQIPFVIEEHELMELVLSLGISQFIVLDTAHVGQEQGPQGLSRCIELRQRYPGLTLITGGGIRDGADLDLLEEGGVHVALMATALHKGCLTSADWERYSFL